jgi:hypothetical protein
MMPYNSHVFKWGRFSWGYFPKKWAYWWGFNFHTHSPADINGERSYNFSIAGFNRSLEIDVWVAPKGRKWAS